MLRPLRREPAATTSANIPLPIVKAEAVRAAECDPDGRFQLRKPFVQPNV